MYKNFRVGTVKYLSKKGPHKTDSLLIEVMEHCNGVTGEYFSTYNVHVECDNKFGSDLAYSNVGDWVLFGFYIQSFKSNNNTFRTVLKLRHYEKLPISNNVYNVTIKNSRIKGYTDDRIISVPEAAFNTMKEITNQTQFNEYGQR